MLEEIYPRYHARFSSLALFGPHVEGFVVWLRDQGYARLPIRRRVRVLPRIEQMLRTRGVRRLEELEERALLGLTPKDSQDDIYLSASVRSLVRYCIARGMLAPSVASPVQQLVAGYAEHLDRVRGFAVSTRTDHAATASEMLRFVEFDGDPSPLRAIEPHTLEALLRVLGARLSRDSLQHTVAHLRSFLRFLASRGLVRPGLDAQIDTPRVYRGERLPRALPWESVRTLLASIDRSTGMGKRDYAMLLLIATYGLRTSEVVALRLDDIQWRQERFLVPRPKIDAPLVLPLRMEVAAALLDYLRNARPDLPHRQVFLRVRGPSGPLGPTAVTEIFHGVVRRGGLDIPYRGAHCLRHSLAVHLLRQGASLLSIRELLGHRSTESTCVYLRLHVEDLRDVALPLPAQVQG